jgi:tetratricopeptide (TPR) repeat protein
MQFTSRRSWLVPASLLFSGFCFAQSAAIQGDVKGMDGKPLQGAVIKIERTDIKQDLKTKTDKKGHYFYGGLGLNGTFNVRVEVQGKEVAGVDGVKPNGTEPAPVNFDLKAAAAAAAGTAPPEQVEKGMTPAEKAAYEKKKKDAEAAIAKNKELNDSFNAGMAAENNKDYNEAITQFEKGVALAPTQHVIWSHLADAYGARATTNEADTAKTDDLNKAAADYQKAIELEPRDPSYHNNYALILARQKKLDDAQTQLNQAASIDPTSAGKYYYNLGAVMANTNQNDAAMAAFKKAMDANYAEAYYQYGLLMMGKATTGADGKIVAPDGTIQAFQKYLDLAPTGPNADGAKAMLTTLGSSVQTSFEQPGAKKKK